MSMDSYDYIMTGNSRENSQRIKQLEQLCRDMYTSYRQGWDENIDCDITKRMEELGLLEVDNEEAR